MNSGAVHASVNPVQQKAIIGTSLAEGRVLARGCSTAWSSRLKSMLGLALADSISFVARSSSGLNW